MLIKKKNINAKAELNALRYKVLKLDTRVNILTILLALGFFILLIMIMKQDVIKKIEFMLM